MKNNNSDFIDAYQQRSIEQLTNFLPKGDLTNNQLPNAMRYAVLNGGKRIRPLLVYTTGDMLGVTLDKLDGPACAVELIHCYSLVHDDLPAMDDDDLRRGLPTCHIEYDEATAILAGDALQALAFQILTEYHAPSVDADKRLKILQILTQACGYEGMAGGQAIDLAVTGKPLGLEILEDMHRKKTGALISASMQMAALSTSCDEKTLANIKKLGDIVGLAFQIQDDILDIEISTEKLGKPSGSDADKNKLTYPKVIGLTQAKQHVDKLFEQASEILEIFPYNTQTMTELLTYLIKRTR